MVANRSLQPTVARYADRMWLRSNVVKQSRHSYSTHHRQVRVDCCPSSDLPREHR